MTTPVNTGFDLSSLGLAARPPPRKPTWARRTS